MFLCVPSIGSALNVSGNWPSSTSKSTYQCTLFLMASTAVPACKSNIRWLRHLTLCVSLLYHLHISLNLIPLDGQ